MKRRSNRVHTPFVLAAFTGLLALQPGPTGAVPIDDTARNAALETGVPISPLPSLGIEPPPAATLAIAKALQRGQWNRACSVATGTLARAETNLDALGTFGMCSALINDQDSVNRALQRLREAEVPPRYYASMTEGILQLKKRAPDKAEATFKTVLQGRAADPLALYFTGEAQHQLKRDALAIASFRSVLKTWPEYAPALAGAARLLASATASPAELKEAVTMTERATAIEPMNLDYWKQMAELYERTGQTDRAAAVRLQWLNPPKAK